MCSPPEFFFFFSHCRGLRHLVAQNCARWGRVSIGGKRYYARKEKQGMTGKHAFVGNISFFTNGERISQRKLKNTDDSACCGDSGHGRVRDWHEKEKMKIRS